MQGTSDTENLKYLSWLDIEPSSRVLVLSDASILPADRSYDVIVCVNCLETSCNPAAFLTEIKTRLSNNGRLYLYCNNRLGLRYFSGELDPYTGSFGDGPDNYIHIHSASGRCYSLNEIKDFLSEAGFENHNLYSVLPSADNPKFIIASDYIPNEKMSIRLFPRYRNPENLFLEEEYVVDELFSCGLMPGMADGLLFEVTPEPAPAKYNEIIISSERKDELSMVTFIGRDSKVIKRPLFKEGEKQLLECKENEDALKERCICVLPRDIETHNGKLRSVSAFQGGMLANEYLQKLFFEDRDRFIAEMDVFREEILKASEVIDSKGNVQAKAYPDMVPLNCFVQDGKYVFFDQEFCFDNYPADSIITRAILIVYELDMKMELSLPKSFFFDRYGLSENLDEWLKLAGEFTSRLYNEGRGQGFRVHKDFVANRFRLRYSERLYEALSYNPVAGLEDKFLFLYGCTDAACKFIEMYQRDFDIRGVIASASDQEETEWAGYPVLDASALKKIDPAAYRIVVCTADMPAARDYLCALGVKDVVFYDPHKVYPGRQAGVLPVKGTERKMYHVGYIAGVFDLYHIGHLNMFKRAKELCDYLIVGVVTDAGVRDFKKTEPYIPFDERIELVRSCCYVDEAVEIPYFNRGTIEAFEKYHFDVQFSGSDYENNPLWLYHKQWLEERGSTMVFFPYTAGVSSSKIKETIGND